MKLFGRRNHSVTVTNSATYGPVEYGGTEVSIPPSVAAGRLMAAVGERAEDRRLEEATARFSQLDLAPPPTNEPLRPTRTDRWPDLITGDWLREHGACDGGAEMFEAAWPAGMELTRGNFARCRELDINLDWAEHLLPVSIHRERYAIVRSYEKRQDDLIAERNAELDDVTARMLQNLIQHNREVAEAPAHTFAT